VKRVGKALVLIGLAVSLVACTPRDGGSCTQVGGTTTTKDGTTLRCQTNDGETTPHWHAV